MLQESASKSDTQTHLNREWNKDCGPGCPPDNKGNFSGCPQDFLVDWILGHKKKYIYFSK